MIYIASTSGNDGTLNMQVTFEVGADPDIAQVNVQNRVALAQPRSPKSRAPRHLGAQAVHQPAAGDQSHVPNSTYDSLYLSNYGDDQSVRRALACPGRSATIFGARLQHADVARSRTHGEPRHRRATCGAVRAQNVVAAGQIGAAPSDPDQHFQYTIRPGRLDDVGAFENIIVRARPTARACASRTSRVSNWAHATTRSASSTAVPRRTSASISYPARTRLPSPPACSRR